MLVLVAEDDRTARRLLTRLLERMGMVVHAAENGVELLALLEIHRPDLVLVDIEMPVLDGLETVRAIRASEPVRDLSIVCISASTDSETVQQMIGLGIKDYLLKPFTPERLSARLREVLKTAVRSTGGAHRTTSSVGAFLVAEADPTIAETLESVLGADRVVGVESGVGALTICREQAKLPDVVLIGEGLGLLNGERCAMSLRRLASERGLSVPRIFRITGGKAPAELGEGFDGAVDRGSLIAAIATTFGPGIFSPEGLATAVRSVLEGAELSAAVTRIATDQQWTADGADEPGEPVPPIAALRMVDSATSVEIEITIGGGDSVRAKLTAGESAVPGVQILNHLAEAIRPLLQPLGMNVEAGDAGPADEPLAAPARVFRYKADGGERAQVSLSIGPA